MSTNNHFVLNKNFDDGLPDAFCDKVSSKEIDIMLMEHFPIGELYIPTDKVFRPMRFQRPDENPVRPTIKRLNASWMAEYKFEKRTPVLFLVDRYVNLSAKFRLGEKISNSIGVNNSHSMRWLHFIFKFLHGNTPLLYFDYKVLFNTETDNTIHLSPVNTHMKKIDLPFAGY